MILLSAGLISRDVVHDQPFSVLPTEIRRYELSLPEPITIIKFTNGTAMVPMVPFAQASTESQRVARLALQHWQCGRKALAGTVLTLASHKNVAQQSLLALQRLTDQVITCTGDDQDQVINKILAALPASQSLVRLRTYEKADACTAVPLKATLLCEKPHLKLFQDSKKLYKVYTSGTAFKKALRWYDRYQQWALPLLRADLCFLTAQNQFVLTLTKPHGVARATAQLKRQVPSAAHFVTTKHSDGAESVHAELDDVCLRSPR